MTSAQLKKLAPDAVKRAMPRTIEPMKATLVDEPFSRDGWIFEHKYDGIRTIAIVKNDSYKLFSRNQKEMTIRYPELEELPSYLDCENAILDGEIVVVDKKGRVDFQQLQSRFGLSDLDEIERLRKTQQIIFYVFDLIYVDGYDLKSSTLLERKSVLKKIIKPRTAKGKKLVQFSEHVVRDGEKLFKQAEKMRAEGIMAKNGQSIYVEKRSNEWLKIKTSMRQEVVIAGYTQPTGSRINFGSLALGLYSGKKFVSVGHVGAGFDHKALRDIYEKLKPLETDTMPYDVEPEHDPDITWLKPKLVCEVRFSEWTKEGSMRHPVFMGLRYDKKPRQCVYEGEHPALDEVMSAEEKAKSKRWSRARRTAYRKKLATEKVSTARVKKVASPKKKSTKATQLKKKLNARKAK